MSYTNPTKIWVIDDRSLDSFICKKLINNVVKNAVIDLISNGERAIERLGTLASLQPALLPNYIFLDINMPKMDGWQFLEEFERLKIYQAGIIHIYMLSSSVYIEDINRSQSNSLVEDFITKPMTTERLKAIFEAA